MADEIESLEVKVVSSSDDAVNGIEKLSATLKTLKSITKGGLGLSAVIKEIDAVRSTTNNVDSLSVDKLDKFADVINKLANIGNFKLSSSFANQISAISEAVGGLKGTESIRIAELASALHAFDGLGEIKLHSIMRQVEEVPDIVNKFSQTQFLDFTEKTKEFAAALQPLSDVPKQNISSTLTQLKKIPQIFNELEKVDMESFKKEIENIAEALKPLSDEMYKVSQGFSAFPAKIQKLIANTNSLSASNNKASASYMNLYARIKMAFTSVKSIGSTIDSWITETNDYIENINLFTVSMGKYADEAKKYAETVSEVMGINPSEWIRNQGVFMTLATGFGVVGDRAYTMSQQLTQLGYDLSSFFNISYEESMQKLQSGISGELEPLRRLGYDLSQAKLQSIALELGIEKNISSMTQAEKAQLRYYAIMTQVTNAQGDMARTLEAPANQLRILKAQVTQAAQALGSIFIPALNAVLPYVIAAVKVVRQLANIVASLVGFEFPEIDYSGIEMAAGEAEDMNDALNNANSSAKELKKTILGFDELNILNDNSSNNSGTGTEDAFGQFDFELPTYDFLSEAVDNKINSIFEKMTQYLGIDGEITSGAELLDTKFGSIAISAGLILGYIAAWKIADSVINGAKSVSQYFKTSADSLSVIDKIGRGTSGLITATLGVSLAFEAGKDIGAGKTSFMTAVNGALGLIATAVGGAMIGSMFGPHGAVIGGLTGLSIGIIASITGISISEGERLEQKFWESEAGKELIQAQKSIEEAAKFNAEMKIRIDSITTEIAPDIAGKLNLANDLLEKIFSLNDIDNKTNDELGTLVELVNTFNDLKLTDASGNGLTLEFDKLTGSITKSKEEMQALIQEIRDSYKLEAAKSALTKLYSEKYELELEFEATTGSKYNDLQDLLNKYKENKTIWEQSKATTLNNYSKWFDSLDSINNIYDPFIEDQYLDSVAYAQKMIDYYDKAISEAENSLQDLGVQVDEYNGQMNDLLNQISIVERDLGIVPTVASDVAETTSNTLKGIASDMSEAGSEAGKTFGENLTNSIEECKGDLINAFNEALTNPTKESLEEFSFEGGQIIKNFLREKVIKSFQYTLNDVIKRLKKFKEDLEKETGGNKALENIAYKFLNMALGSFKIPQYATGGFPQQGQLFIARERSAELVGSIGNRTAVANNEQIVDGIKQGVKEAMLESNGNGGGDWVIQIVENGTVKQQTTITAAQRINTRAGKTIIPIGV